jgi:hypothetical protein
VRCREHRRADLHSSQIDDLKGPSGETKTPRPVAPVVPGYHRLVPRPNANPLRYSPIRPNAVLARRSPTKTIGWGVLRPNLPGLQTAHNVDRPGTTTTATPMLASPTGLSSSRYCSTSSKINGNSKRSTPRPRRRDTHSSTAHDCVTKLLDSMPGWDSPGLDRPPIRPLTTILDYHPLPV